MKELPLDVLEAQTDLRRLPLSYVVGSASGAPTVSLDDLLESVLRAHVSPRTPKQVRTALLALEDHTQVAAALQAGRLDGLLSADDRARLGDELRRVQSRLLAALRRAAALCRARYERLDPDRTVVLNVEHRLTKALESIDDVHPIADDIANANRILEDLRADLEAAEEREIERLTADFGRLLETSRREAMSDAITRALADRDLSRARYLLNSTQTGDQGWSGELPPFRNPITSSQPPECLARWMTLDSAPDAPFGFRKLWGPAREDEVGGALLASIAQLIDDATPLSTDLFSTFVSALEHALGVPNEMRVVRPLVSLRQGRFVAQLRGVRGEGLYAFEDAVYDAGVPIVYEPPAHRALAPAERASEDTVKVAASAGEITREMDGELEGDQDAVEYESEGSGVGMPDGYWIALEKIPVYSVQGRPIVLRWRSLLSVVGDPHRAHSLRRLIGPQTLPEDAFPDATRRRSTAAPLVGRAQLVEAMRGNEGAALWIGPRGSGRSALVARLEAEARSGGVAVHRLGSALQVEKVEQMMVSGALSDFGASSAQPLLFTIDDLPDLDGLDRGDASDGTNMRIVALMQFLRDLGDSRVSATATADVAFAATLGSAPWRRIPPLSFEASRMLITRLLDVTGGSMDAHGIDQIAYFAGGYPRLLHFALRMLRQSLSADRLDWRISPRAVQELLERDDIRGQARNMLLSTVDELPSTHATVFAVTYELCVGRRGAAAIVTTEQICHALSVDWQITISTEVVRRALACLNAAYLLDRTEHGWRLPTSGLGQLLVDEELQLRLANWLVADDTTTTGATVADARAGDNFA